MFVVRCSSFAFFILSPSLFFHENKATKIMWLSLRAIASRSCNRTWTMNPHMMVDATAYHTCTVCLFTKSEKNVEWFSCESSNNKKPGREVVPHEAEIITGNRIGNFLNVHHSRMITTRPNELDHIRLSGHNLTVVTVSALYRSSLTAFHFI